jgi:hypothetical protein
VITKELFGWLSLVLTVISYAPYIASILRGKTRPHVFTWFVWFINMSIVYFGQHIAGAGPGAWATGLTALLNSIVIVLALTRGEKNITRFDWACFLASLLAIPLWGMTRDPVYAVVLVTFIDLAGYGPTVRKSFFKPQEENISPYLIGTPKHILAIMALEAYTTTTLCFPAAIATANVGLVAMILWRKRILLKNRAFDAAAGAG